MSQFRLHIDIPLGADQESAIQQSKELIENLKNLFGHSPTVLDVSYRLGNDDDRQKSNYLDKNENGHVSTKKCKL